MLILELCSALGLCWCIEQPRSSLLMRHPRLQAFIKKHTESCPQLKPGRMLPTSFHCSNMYLLSMFGKVFQIHFWMKCWGSPTAKRSTLWSCSRGIRRFSTHAMSMAALRSPVILAEKSFNKRGGKTYTGNQKLKRSQSSPQIGMPPSTLNYKQHTLSCPGNIHGSLRSALPAPSTS